MASTPGEPPFVRLGPEAPASPVVLSVPHAGRAYSPALLKASRLPVEKLELLEDRYVDRLVWRAVAAGATAFVALVPRAEIDLNRDPRELDPAMVIPAPALRSVLATDRTRGGLGLIPARIAGSGSIWLHRITGAEIARRLEQVHEPYHAALHAALASARDRFGTALLLDCHSMPPREGSRAASVIIGDRHGTSASAGFRDAAAAAIRRAGFKSACNDPYAGGYVTARHGRPRHGIHALQIEIDRRLYLDAALNAPGVSFDMIAGLIEEIVAALAGQILHPAAIAAE